MNRHIIPTEFNSKKLEILEQEGKIADREHVVHGVNGHWFLLSLEYSLEIIEAKMN